MKIVSLMCLMLALTIVGLSQERSLQTPRSRAQQPELFEYPALHLAAGMAQSPQGYPVLLSDTVPSQSVVGLYGSSLQANNVSKVLLQSGDSTWEVNVQIFPTLWFKRDTAVFRLPPDAHGEVWVNAVGRFGISNTVRFWVD